MPFTEVRDELERWENHKFKLGCNDLTYLVDIQIEVGQAVGY